MSRRRMTTDLNLPVANEPAATGEPPPPPPSASGKPAGDDGGGGGSGLLAWLFGGLVLLGALAVGVFAAYWIFMHLIVTIRISDQQAGIILPETLNATAEITNLLDVSMDGEIRASVPFKQELTVPFRGRYDFDVVMNAQVPVEFDVGYEGILPVNTQADVTISTGINYKNLKALRNLKIETTLPLKFPLPVNLNIPVKDTIDLTYTGPLSADINQDVRTTVDTVLNTRLPINQRIQTPVTAALPLEVKLDQSQARLILTELIIDLVPSEMLGIGLAQDTSGPVRVDTPWGPADEQDAPAGTP